MEVDKNTVGILVGFLLAVIIGVLIYFSMTENIDVFNVQTEYFTGYSHGDNATEQTVTVRYSPASKEDTNVTCWSEIDGTLSYPDFRVVFKDITIAAGSASNYTQINVTYTSHAGMTEESDVTPMADTVFGLLPIVALVVVASVILVIVLGFGKSPPKGFKGI